ncbi:MAG: DegQ family serine endoprotease [Thermodesulfovibrionales bacterium]|nr:DegQ family serine endoprotease [Thermodesulfovibrionales bacterium]
MYKKFLLIPILILISFLLGGLSYYFLSKSVTPPYHTFTPRVPPQIQETSKAFSEIVTAVSPAVVNISSTKTFRRQPSPFDDLFDFLYPFPDGRSRRWKEQSLGSGVIITHDGYIVTNNHVIERAEDIKVIFIDKKVYKAKIVGTDPKTDIAVIKIDANNLPVLQWGDSDSLQVGEFVLAIGNPFGLSNTVTMGIVSAIGRTDVGIADYENFIQTDAAINPGNSGGPLVNMKGEVIGINTAIFSKTGGYQGIGFAVPSNMVKNVIDQLIKKGKVIRGWIGVTIQELTPEIAEKFGLKSYDGVIITDVAKGGPAHNAGLGRGDIILEFNGKKVKDASFLRNLVAQTEINQQVKLKILRNGQEMTVVVTVRELPSKDIQMVPSSSTGDLDQRANPLFEVSVIDLNPVIAKQLGVDLNEKGVVVTKIQPGSVAEESGLRKGDIIQEIDRFKVTNLSDYNKILSQVARSSTILLFINRSGKKFYITLSQPS